MCSHPWPAVSVPKLLYERINSNNRKDWKGVWFYALTERTFLDQDIGNLKKNAVDFCQNNDTSAKNFGHEKLAVKSDIPCKMVTIFLNTLLFKVSETLKL